MTLRGLLLAGFLACPMPLSALTLEFPGAAATTAEHHEALGSYDLPIGPWANGAAQQKATQGAIHQSAWRLDSRGLTTMQLLAPLRDQLVAKGFRVLFECDTEACGGFDFRYSTQVLPEPEMHVDLGDFRFLAAEKPGTEAEYVSLLVSRSSATGFVQVFHVGPGADKGAVALTSSTKTPVTLARTPVTGKLAEALELDGGAALDDLAFETGSASLGTGEFESLKELADYLKANPERAVTLVGHTDAVGALETNIALSKRRAVSVRNRLIEVYGVAPAQIGAEGAGFLAPRATNLTDDGRTRNRRVEVMLTSTR